jgi:hypothetical protein
MRMKVSGLQNVELVGDIAGFRESDGYLMMTIRLTKPVGWQASAALTHKDLMKLIKLFLLNPSNLRYILFGFGKPGRSKTGGVQKNEESI